MPDTIHDTEKELLRKIAEGDEKSFARLFDQYGPRVLQVAYQYTHSDQQSQDILQDVFMKCWLIRVELPAIKSLESWIFVVTRNKALTVLEKNARFLVTGEAYAEHLPALDTSSESRLEAAELENMIRDAIATLPPQQRKVFELAKMKNLNRQEIATDMGISPNTVKVHLNHATRAVRAYLATKLDYLTVYILFHYLFK